jgi:hypothetical protein
MTFGFSNQNEINHGPCYVKEFCGRKSDIRATENKEQSQKLTRTVRTSCFPPFNFKPFFDHEGV